MIKDEREEVSAEKPPTLDYSKPASRPDRQFYRDLLILAVFFALFFGAGCLFFHYMGKGLFQ